MAAMKKSFPYAFVLLMVVAAIGIGAVAVPAYSTVPAADQAAACIADDAAPTDAAAAGGCKPCKNRPWCDCTYEGQPRISCDPCCYQSYPYIICLD
jgi:hypothetical protein